MSGLATLSAAALMMAGTAHPLAVPRQPTEKWLVNFDAARCVASRNYGTAQSPMLLALKASPLGGVMQLSVLHIAKTGRPDEVQGTLKIDERQPLRTSVLVYPPTNPAYRGYRINLSAADFAPLRLAKSITIRALSLNETFALSNMGPLLKTMDDCLIDLRSVWNVTDPAGAQSKLKERAKANLASYFSDHDYPAAAFVQGESGVVVFALLVDEKGMVADCTVIETSGRAALDTQTCSTLEDRAKFTPAIGTDGKPAKDAVIGRIRWQTTNQRKAPFN